MIFLMCKVNLINLTGQNGDFDNPNVNTNCWQHKSSLYKETSRWKNSDCFFENKSKKCS